MLFLYLSYPQNMHVFLVTKDKGKEPTRPPPKQRIETDFVKKRCMKFLKRIRKFIYTINYLYVREKRGMLADCCAHIKLFTLDMCDIMIERLEAI